MVALCATIANLTVSVTKIKFVFYYRTTICEVDPPQKQSLEYYSLDYKTKLRIHLDFMLKNLNEQRFEFLKPNERVKVVYDKKKCLVCTEKDAEYCFSPCKHAGFCFNCAARILKKSGSCKFCLKPVDEITRTGGSIKRTPKSRSASYN